MRERVSSRILFLGLLLALAFPAFGANPTPVPIAALLKDPAAYDGKQVRITGAAVVRFEAVFVCQFVDDIVVDSQRCLWMVPDEINGAAVRLAPMHNRIVEITGRFRADRHGHMDAYGGQIVVSRYAILGTHALGDVPPMLPEPPVPWHVDAYIGFERAAEFDPPGSGEHWYWQNALQISGSKVKLHKQTLACRDGKTWSTEGDGGAQSFEGTLAGSIRQGNVSLRYIGCDGCLSSREHAVQVLPIRQLSDDALRMGSVTYDRATKPYPDKCPVID